MILLVAQVIEHVETLQAILCVCIAALTAIILVDLFYGNTL